SSANSRMAMSEPGILDYEARPLRGELNCQSSTLAHEWEVSLRNGSGRRRAFDFRRGGGGFDGAEFAGAGAAEQNGVARKNCAERPVDSDLKLLFQVDEFV